MHNVCVCVTNWSIYLQKSCHAKSQSHKHKHIVRYDQPRLRGYHACPRKPWGVVVVLYFYLSTYPSGVSLEYPQPQLIIFRPLNTVCVTKTMRNVSFNFDTICLIFFPRMPQQKILEKIQAAFYFHWPTFQRPTDSVCTCLKPRISKQSKTVMVRKLNTPNIYNHRLNSNWEHFFFHFHNGILWTIR